METTAITTNANGSNPTGPSKADKTWSVPLAKGGWTPVPTAFFEFYPKLQLTGVEVMFLLNIVNFKRHDPKAYPSYKLLASRLGVKERRAREVAKSLIDKGLLSRIERRRKGNRSKTNLFGIEPLIARLEQLQTQKIIEDLAAKQATLENRSEIL